MKTLLASLATVFFAASSSGAETLVIAGVVLLDDGNSSEARPLPGAKIGLYDFTNHSPLVSDVTDESGVFLLVVRSYDPFAKQVKINYRGFDYYGEAVVLAPEAWPNSPKVYAARCRYTVGPRAKDRKLGTPEEAVAYLEGLRSSLELQRQAGEIDDAAVRAQIAQEVQTIVAADPGSFELLAALNSTEFTSSPLASAGAQAMNFSFPVDEKEAYVADSDLWTDQGGLVGRDIWGGDSVHAHWLVAGEEDKLVEIKLCPQSGGSCFFSRETNLGAGSFRVDAELPKLTAGDYELTLSVNGEARVGRNLSVKEGHGEFVELPVSAEGPEGR